MLVPQLIDAHYKRISGYFFNSIMKLFSIVIILLLLTIKNSLANPSISCELRENLSSSIKKSPGLTWSQLRDACQHDIAAYQTKDPMGYAWFTNAANGFAGTPLLILKALPDLAPEIWGAVEDNFLKFSLFSDPQTN